MTVSASSTRLAARALLIVLLGASTIVALPQESRAASQQVSINDNRFTPQEVRIQPGDTVVWSNQAARVHDVTSDEQGAFRSPDLQPGDTFTHTFNEEGFFYYYCSFHGSRRKVGMWGLVVVGDPDPSTDPYADLGGGRDVRPKLVVPRDFPSIQKAIDNASPGTTVLVRPGVYKTKVVINKPDIVLKGVDRFRTVLHGEDERQNGIVVDGTKNIRIENLTVRNYTGNGVFINNTRNYTVNKVDAIKGRTYGIYAFDSYDGVIKNSYAYGSGDGAFYIGQCLYCSAVITNVKATWSYLGYSGTNATGVVIKDSVFTHNAVGIAPNTLPTEDLGPNRGTFMYNNRVFDNNYASIPAAGFSDNPIGVAIGTGIWMPGVENNVAMNNIVYDHNSYGILISQTIDSDVPINNTVVDNHIRNSDFDEDGYGYDLAYDGTGGENCWEGNDFTGETGPPDIQTLYPCNPRTASGVPYPPVQAHIYEAAASSQSRPQEEPPDPKRPRCQRGAPGCDR